MKFHDVYCKINIIYDLIHDHDDYIISSNFTFISDVGYKEPRFLQSDIVFVINNCVFEALPPSIILDKIL